MGIDATVVLDQIPTGPQLSFHQFEHAHVTERGQHLQLLDMHLLITLSDAKLDECQHLWPLPIAKRALTKLMITCPQLDIREYLYKYLQQYDVYKLDQECTFQRCNLSLCNHGMAVRVDIQDSQPLPVKMNFGSPNAHGDREYETAKTNSLLNFSYRGSKGEVVLTLRGGNLRQVAEAAGFNKEADREPRLDGTIVFSMGVWMRSHDVLPIPTGVMRVVHHDDDQQLLPA
jgi:hypothetical protein